MYEIVFAPESPFSNRFLGLLLPFCGMDGDEDDDECDLKKSKSLSSVSSGD